MYKYKNETAKSSIGVDAKKLCDSNFKVDQALDAEALRVLKMMPDWEPAIIGGILRTPVKHTCSTGWRN